VTKTELGEVVAALEKSLETPLRERLERFVNERLDTYRRSVWVREEWCCNEMRAFATKFWGASKPRTDETWGVRYQIRGHGVNYCPFCGASVVSEVSTQ
jgi:hypothetical protein